MFRFHRTPIGLITVLAGVVLAIFRPEVGVSGEPLDPGNPTATVIVVVGAPGEDEYGSKFSDWSAKWEKASRDAGANFLSVGYGNEVSTNEAEQLQTLLRKEPKSGSSELWLVLLGHGTFDGREAKFNLRGPDLTATEIAKSLEEYHRPTAVIAAFAASAPFLAKLAAEDRVVITSTRSGHEQNYSRFGEFISGAIADPEADLDKDGQTSLLEAYLTASRRTQEFYETEGRLATEHPLLDDNGDGLATPPSWFRGVRAVKKAKEGAKLDGLRAHQFHLVRNQAERQLSAEVRKKRDQLELGIAKLRESKAKMNEEEYYGKLETMLVEMAQLYQGATNGTPAPK